MAKFEPNGIMYILCIMLFFAHMMERTLLGKQEVRRWEEQSRCICQAL